jgi:hypothetical protein
LVHSVHLLDLQARIFGLGTKDHRPLAFNEEEPEMNLNLWLPVLHFVELGVMGLGVVFLAVCDRYIQRQ